MRLIRSIARNSRGATAIEYSLIAGFIFLAIVVSVGLVGGNTANLFSNASSQWTNAAGP